MIKSGTSREGFTDVKVNRDTALGNPFDMHGRTHGETLRDTVCNAHEDWLNGRRSGELCLNSLTPSRHRET